MLIFLSIVSAAAAGLAGFAGRQYLRLSSVQASAAVALLAGLIFALAAWGRGVSSRRLCLRFLCGHVFGKGDCRSPADGRGGEPVRVVDVRWPRMFNWGGRQAWNFRCPCGLDLYRVAVYGQGIC